MDDDIFMGMHRPEWDSFLAEALKQSATVREHNRSCNPQCTNEWLHDYGARTYIKTWDMNNQFCFRRGWEKLLRQAWLDGMFDTPIMLNLDEVFDRLVEARQRQRDR